MGRQWRSLPACHPGPMALAFRQGASRAWGLLQVRHCQALPGHSLPLLKYAPPAAHCVGLLHCAGAAGPGLHPGLTAQQAPCPCRRAVTIWVGAMHSAGLQSGSPYKPCRTPTAPATGKLLLMMPQDGCGHSRATQCPSTALGSPQGTGKVPTLTVDTGENSPGSARHRHHSEPC